MKRPAGITFNPSQEKAIAFQEGPVLVLSGAGSGKTGVITHRVARLLASGVKPERILCLTFTRKAASEMKERISGLAGEELAKKCFIGTFHAWGLIFLKKHADLFFPTPAFTLYDNNDRKDALVHVLKEIGDDFSGSVFRSYGEQISLAKSNLLTIPEVSEEFREVYRRYENFLANRKACDFDDLLFIPYRILNSHPSWLEKYQSRYDYLLVDEYQDTNKAQYTLLRLLTGKKPNIMVVGDDDQSIYSWRGARLENILDFEKDFPETEIIHLETNYRSSKNIIACANSLIANNQERKTKKLIPIHPSGEKIHVFEAADPYGEAKRVAEIIQTKMLKEDCGYGDFAILYRAKHQSKVLKEVLIQSRIPYQVFGEIGFFDRKEIRDILAFLKLLINPHDDLSMLRVINTPKRIRETALRKILEETINRQQTLYEWIKNLSSGEGSWIKPGEAEKLSLFLHFLDRYHAPQGKDIPEVFREFLYQVEYRQGLQTSGENEAVRERREKCLEQFFEIMNKYFEKNPRSDLDAFLIRITMENEEKESDLPLVSLLTIHAAKGLEFPHVFIIGFEENLLPFSKEDYPSAEEEERRLGYVALTRAQKTCTLSFCKTRKTAGGDVHNPPSRFLKEIEEIASPYLIREYGSRPEKPPVPPQHEREQLRDKALSRMKALLKE